MAEDDSPPVPALYGPAVTPPPEEQTVYPAPVFKGQRRDNHTLIRCESEALGVDMEDLWAIIQRLQEDPHSLPAYGVYSTKEEIIERFASKRHEVVGRGGADADAVFQRRQDILTAHWPWFRAHVFRVRHTVEYLSLPDFVEYKNRRFPLQEDPQ